MIKFILTSFLLLLLLGTVSSDLAALKVVAGNKGYKTSNELRGYYSQQDSHAEGYHKAEVYFKTKVQSLNPDQAGASKINCKDNKITLSFNDKNAIKHINNWSNKVMLLISHKWECFGKTTTQFFMVEDKTIDTSNKKATFTVKECNINEWAEEFLIDISWEEGKTKRHFARDISLPPINGNKTLSLNALFDEKTGKTSKPDIPLIDDILFCTNCFVTGKATAGLRFAAEISPIKLIEASISLNGHIKLNLDLAAKGAVGAGIDISSKLLDIPIPLGIGIDIPDIFTIGPSIELVASAKLFAGAESTISFGGEIGFPKFSAKATFVDKPKFKDSGFKSVSKSHGINIDVDADASVDINSSLKPRLAFGLDILNGLFSQQVGFQFVASLDASVSVDSDKCKRTQTRLKTALNGDFGFFINEDDYPILKFPETKLLNKCA